MGFSQGLILDANARLVNTDMTRRPPEGILRIIRAYDDKLDLRWDAEGNQWDLWRVSEVADIPVFVMHVGERIDGTLLAKLRQCDSRREGWDDEAMRRVDDLRREQKAQMRETALMMREYMNYVNSVDDIATAVKRAEEVIAMERDKG